MSTSMHDRIRLQAVAPSPLPAALLGAAACTMGRIGCSPVVDLPITIVTFFVGSIIPGMTSK